MLDLVSENRHKISLITSEEHLLNEGVVPFFADYFLHHLVEHIDPQVAIGDCAKSMPFWKCSLHPSYTIIMNDQSGANEWGELAASYRWIDWV